MSEPETITDRKWLQQQVARYRRLYPRYRRYAQVLKKVLENLAAELAPQAIVQTRAKAVVSFAEKALRKAYPDPINRFTDLCGGRIITRTRSEVEAVSRFIEEHFDVDKENSVDASHRLEPTEFGYRSAHYIVSFGREGELGVEIPEELYGLKAEIQVRTLAEHAWSDFGHDVTYKGAFELPDRWKRELAVVAAELEDVDKAFARIEEGLRTYAASYEAYLSEEEIRREMDRLEAVLAHDPGNDRLAWRIGKLAITLGDWEKAVGVMSPYMDPRDLEAAYQPLLRDLGIAVCKRNRKNPEGREYRRGQRYLEKAIELDPGDTDALASLAGTWKGVDDEKARELYRQAFEVDPTDFYPLTNFLDYEIGRARNTSILRVLGPVVAGAIERCRAQAEVGINLPWVYFGMGKLNLLLGKPHESLEAYARAVQASTAAFMIEGSLDSLERLSPVREALPGYEWARRMLLVGLAARFPTPGTKRRLSRLASPRGAIRGPVVIVVGGTDPSIEREMKGYRLLMLEAFVDFAGTVISGGTQQGVSGLVGDVAEKYADRIHTVGYLPRRLPADATRDDRYGEIRRTDGTTFSLLEPLQNWIDLLVSGVDPKDVKVLGINGGAIAALEYRIALALEASVGVIQGTGREAAKLLADQQWVVSETLVPMPADPQTVRAFIGSGASELSPEERETIARAIHDRHREEVAGSRPADDPSMRDWDDLPESLRESNRQQADHIFAKLRQLGCTVQRVTDRDIALMRFTADEVETMAEMEHGRWNAERLTDGWRWGEKKDVLGKVHPDLVGWAELPDATREWDRQTVRKIPEFLASIGLEVRRDG